MLRRGAIALALVALPVVGWTDAASQEARLVKAQYGPVVYHYCYVNAPPYGQTVYFSDSFGVKSDTYEVGIQNAFNAFVTGRFDSNVISGAQCMGPYATMREAADELNEHMGERRRDGKQVVMTWWRYSGD